jgi:beta-phosphoglucomutase
VRQQGIEPLPGVSEWVRRLHQQGWRQAIASAAPRKNIETILEALHTADCFDAIVSAEDVHRGKPDPEVFLVAASKLDVPPSQCIVVEDALHGFEAAHAAGIKCIGVTRSGKPLPADVTTNSLAGLAPNVFDNLLSQRQQDA